LPGPPRGSASKPLECHFDSRPRGPTSLPALPLPNSHLAAEMDKESRALDRHRAAKEPIAAAVASHRLEVLRMERELLESVEPMLGGA